MPKRKRDRNPAQAGDAPLASSPTAGSSTPSAEPVDPAVAEALALFAERHRAEREAEQQAKRAKQAAVRRASELDRLTKAKEEAVARLKAVRRQERVPPGETEAAEAAYTAAAADLVALETGQRPSWAPALPDPGDPTEPDKVAEPDGTGPADQLAETESTDSAES